jgi:ATP-dependent DNA helicase DinG
MAVAVAEIIERGGTLLVEAGTGTGKTLAYLVPAVLSGRRVLLSTGTKTLQDQIFYKDLPLVAAALKVPLRATYLKGRGNYLCLHRFETFRGKPGLDAAEEASYLPIIEQWAARTETGDRAELADLPEELSCWHDISAASEHCLGTSCPRYDDCFVTRMRRQAAESDLVVVNHYLLCADAAVRQSAYGEVIPACRVLILDEAHQLEDAATQYFGVAVSNYRLETLVRDGLRLLGGGLLAEPPARGTLLGWLERIGERSRQLFAALEPLAPPDDRVRLSGATLAPLADPGFALVDELAALEGAVALLAEAPEAWRALGRRAGEVAAELRFLLQAADPAYVYFLERRQRGVFLRAAPIDVAPIVRSLLLERLDAAVLTSATLAVDGSFDYVKTRLGLGAPRELRLPSEYDFSRQAILYLPRRLPDPRSHAFGPAAAREIGEILRRTEGRAFVLFTSYARLREVAPLLADAVDYPLLVQGAAPRSALLRRFRETPHAVLLATTSFWQGVDVPGDALSCVIVDKLPFAVPGDPIVAARIEALAARGADPFLEYQVPLAILLLRQGLGRLIRHRQDRGVLAILDPRVRTKAYGRRFLAALPPAPVTEALDDLERFFRA